MAVDDHERQICMFCGSSIDASELSREHFVPKCLWEKGRRPSGLKTLPAHSNCNAAFSDDNDYFRDVLVAEAGAELHQAARELQQNTLKRKLMKRPGSLFKNIKNLRKRTLVLPSGIMIPNQPTYEVDSSRMGRVLKNIAKGVYYTSQRGLPLPLFWHFQYTDVAYAKGEVRDYIQKRVDYMCDWQHFGDTAFACRYVVSSSKPHTQFSCLMQFYMNRQFFLEAFDAREFSPLAL